MLPLEALTSLTAASSAPWLAEIFSPLWLINMLTSMKLATRRLFSDELVGLLKQNCSNGPFEWRKVRGYGPSCVLLAWFSSRFLWRLLLYTKALFSVKFSALNLEHCCSRSLSESGFAIQEISSVAARTRRWQFVREAFLFHSCLERYEQIFRHAMTEHVSLISKCMILQNGHCWNQALLLLDKIAKPKDSRTCTWSVESLCMP